MSVSAFDMGNIDVAWCPGCGNYGILTVLKRALTELNITPENLVMVSGIGQAAKIPHYFRAHFFNGLHGRALPPATAIKAANPSMTVIAESGDGDMYGEGGNHFIHTIRRNPGITNVVHNNMVYGLTKGQASPTSQLGFKTPVQVAGVFLEPFNPIAVAIALDAGFVARAFIGDAEQTKEILKKAITHKGYALVDVSALCHVQQDKYLAVVQRAHVLS
jgi:2-oxoglutarate ferredoxin oxidoreductase subunit beta